MKLQFFDVRGEAHCRVMTLAWLLKEAHEARRLRENRSKMPAKPMTPHPKR